MRHWPALEVDRPDDTDLLLADADDFGVTAVDEVAGPVGPVGHIRLFFATASARDTASAALAGRYRVRPVEVDDEDWARRSQENLAPVEVGRITIVPRAETEVSNRPITITIEPSMGFGTGHHATTRLCLAGLQRLDLTGRFVLDAGTGSGVLAIAAVRLGAAGALGIDYDQDAIHSAERNLALNPAARGVTFRVADLTATSLPPADVVVANLTGTLLVKMSAVLLERTRPGGTLIVSGLLEDEAPAVQDAFGDVQTLWESREDGWVARAMKK